MSTTPPLVHILCVGDGDLTFSLALIRAYGNQQIDLTASTLLDSRDELIDTYCNSSAVLEELEERQVKVLFGLDATQLHTHFPPSRFDAIIFSHPHLGLETLEESESWHAERHHRLLSHYLWSAAQCAKSIHLCLCGNQPQTWRLQEAVTRVDALAATQEFETHLCPSECWLSSFMLVELPPQPNHSAPRKYRNGKLGSKHFLGKYGYQHRPTHPNSVATTVNVQRSVHFVFQSVFSEDSTRLSSSSCLDENVLACQACAATFESIVELREHQSAPAKPNAVVKQQPGEPVKSVVPHVSEVDNAEVASNVKQSIVGPIEWSGHPTQPGRLWQAIRSKMNLSKRNARDLVKYGCVSVNGVKVEDDARVVTIHDTLEVCQLELEDPLTVNVIHQDSDWIVVMKPVGMRAMGTFSDDTLESTVSRQMKTPYKCCSKLDTGCSGLCVLQKEHTSTTEITSIHRVFKALVHGKVDFQETLLPLQSDGSFQRWKRKRENQNMDQIVTGTDCVVTISSKVTLVETIKVECLETCSVPPLSTLTLTITNPNVHVDAIMYALRDTLHHSIVNDRFCHSKEYLALPRSMRNHIKQRLCIMCCGVVLNTRHEISVPAPERLSAQHWHQHCSKEENAFSKREGHTG